MTAREEIETVLTRQIGEPLTRTTMTEVLLTYDVHAGDAGPRPLTAAERLEVWQSTQAEIAIEEAVSDLDYAVRELVSTCETARCDVSELRDTADKALAVLRDHRPPRV